VDWVRETRALGVGAITNPQKWKDSGQCFDECWRQCNEELNISPIPGVPAAPPIFDTFCAAKCFDDSGCATLPYATIDWTDPQSYPDLFKPPKPAAPSPAPPPAPAPSSPTPSSAPQPQPTVSPTTTPSTPSRSSSWPALLATSALAAVVWWLS